MTDALRSRSIAGVDQRKVWGTAQRIAPTAAAAEEEARPRHVQRVRLPNALEGQMWMQLGAADACSDC